MDLPVFTPLPGFKAPPSGDGQNPGTTVLFFKATPKKYNMYQDINMKPGSYEA